MSHAQAKQFIGGEWTNPTSSNKSQSTNPANGSVVGEIADGNCKDAEAAVNAARVAFDTSLWAHQPRERQMVLLRWADAMERDVEKLAHILTLTNGKPLSASRGEVNAAVSEIRYYAGLTRHIPGPAMEVAPGEYSVMLREAAGVAGIIVPWNAPGILLIRSLAPALAAGCTTVIKPAPQTALFSLACMASLTTDPDLPRGAVNIVTETGHDIAKVLVTSPEVDVVSFTGSNAVGAQIMADAAPTMKKLSLELGGKSCCIVLDDADIGAIAPKLAAAATIISGQQCTAARRILVHRSRLKDMSEAMANAISAISIGDGLESDVAMGPLIDIKTRNAIAERIARAEADADSVALRAVVPNGQDGGAFITPSVVVHEDENADFCQEEIFGPFVTIEPFDDETHAVAKANNTVFGLSASVWTNRNDSGWRIARALRNGTVWLNDHNKLFAEAETGGYRRSGLGRLHGYDALLDFSELKHVYQNVGVI